jgi:hypothetical protein
LTIEYINRIQNNIPTEEDWQGYQDDLDARFAYKLFFGKNIVEVQPVFQMNVIERAWELRALPVKAFQYYVFALRDFIINNNHVVDPNAPIVVFINAAVDCYFSLVQFKLDEYPEHILPVMEALLPSLHFISDHVTTFHIDEEIYGSIPARLQRLLQRYRQLRN